MRQHLIEEQVLQPAGDKAGAELTEDTAVEAGIGQVEPDWKPLLTDTLTVSFWSGAQQLWLWPTKTGFGCGGCHTVDMK